MKKFILISLLLAIPAVVFLMYLNTFNVPFWVFAVIGWVFGWTIADTAFKLSNITRC